MVSDQYKSQSTVTSSFNLNSNFLKHFFIILYLVYSVHRIIFWLFFFIGAFASLPSSSSFCYLAISLYSFSILIFSNFSSTIRCVLSATKYRLFFSFVYWFETWVSAAVSGSSGNLVGLAESDNGGDLVLSLISIGYIFS